MTGRRTRIRVTVGSLLALTSIVIAIAMHPWPEGTTAPDPRVLALQRREVHLAREALAVKRALKQRWRAYERRLARRQRAIVEARRGYEERLAAARRAAAERARVFALAAQVQASRDVPGAPVQAAATAPASVNAAVPATPPAPAVKVVTLPPAVSVVELPPVTVTRTS